MEHLVLVTMQKLGLVWMIKFGLDDITQFGLVSMIKDMIARITLGLLDPCFPALVAPRSVQPEFNIKIKIRKMQNLRHQVVYIVLQVVYP